MKNNQFASFYLPMNGIHQNDLIKELPFTGSPAFLERKNLERISRDALQTLQDYSWPGNVRELKAEIERTVAVAVPEKQTLEVDDLSPKVRMKFPQTNAPFSHLAEKIKLPAPQMIVEAVALNHGNKSQAARYLEVKHRTLYQRMKTLKIPL